MTTSQTTPGELGRGGRPSKPAFDQNAQHRLGGAGPEETMPAADLSAGTPGHPLDAIVTRLFPTSAPSEQTELARVLAALLTTRVGACIDDMIRTRLAAMSPDLRSRLDGTAEDVTMLLERLLPSLDHAAAFALLATTGAVPQPLLHDLSPARREAILDATFKPTVMERFDRACRPICSRQLAMRLDRLPLDHVARAEWRQKVLAADQEAVVPAPQHQDADEASLLAALQRGDRQAAILLLAAASLVPRESIESALALRTRRGLISLAWKAGFSMRAAVLLQSELAGIAPDSVLTALEDGSCPLSRNEMVWQISFLARKLT